MTAFSVKFYGGPLAGQIHMIDNPPTRYRVPSFTRVQVVSGDALAYPESYEIEEYELGPRHGDDHVYTYTWVNPAAELRRYLKETREVKERYRMQVLELQARLEDAEAKAEKWDALVSATGKLLDEA